MVSRYRAALPAISREERRASSPAKQVVKPLLNQTITVTMCMVAINSL